MQTQEPPQYRFNSKVAIILAVTLLALIVPVAGVVLAIKDVFFKPEPEKTVSAAPLQTALEDIAAKNLKPPPLLAGGDQRVEVTSEDPAKETQRIEKLARNYGGIALPASAEGDNLRMLIQISAARVQSFIKACSQPGLKPESSPTTPASGQARILVEVVITKAAS